MRPSPDLGGVVRREADAHLAEQVLRDRDRVLDEGRGVIIRSYFLTLLGLSVQKRKRAV
jgi:hypothetical protein